MFLNVNVWVCLVSIHQFPSCYSVVVAVVEGRLFMHCKNSFGYVLTQEGTGKKCCSGPMNLHKCIWKKNTMDKGQEECRHCYFICDLAVIKIRPE